MKRQVTAAVLACVLMLGLVGMMAFFLGGCTAGGTVPPAQVVTVVKEFTDSSKVILAGFKQKALDAGDTAGAKKYGDLLGYVNDAEALLAVANGDTAQIQAVVIDLVGKIKVKDPVVAALVQVAAQTLLHVVFPEPVAATAKAPAS